MIEVLKHVASKQNMRDDPSVLLEIARDSNGNLRKALLVFEALKMQTGTLTGPIAIAKPDWETYCNKVGDMIIQEQTPNRVMEVRAKLYELLSHCIPPTIILKVGSGTLCEGM